MSGVCRVCLAGNVRLYYIEKIELLDVYEKIACTNFYGHNGKPETLCCKCYLQLQKCNNFINQTQRTETILDNLIQNNVEPTYKNVLKMDIVIKDNLSLSPIFVNYYNPNHNQSNKINSPISVETDRTAKEIYSFKGEITAEEETTERENHLKKYKHNYKLHKKPEDLVPEENKILDETETDGFVTKKEVTFKLKEEMEIDNCVLKDQRIVINNLVLGEEKVLRRIVVQDLVHRKAKGLGNTGIIDIIHETEKMLNKTGIHDLVQEKEKMLPKTERDDLVHEKEKMLPKTERDDLVHEKEKMLPKTGRDEVHVVNIVDCLKFEDDDDNDLPPQSTEPRKVNDASLCLCCKVCSKIFKRKSQLDLHMKCHVKGNKNVCKVCKKTFAYKSILMTHMKIHMKEMLHACEKCDMKFTRESLLLEHIMHVHDNHGDYVKNEVYSCDLCEKKFHNKQNFATHMTLHTARKTSPCFECGKTFSDEQYLLKHIERHKNCKYQCHICGNKYRQKSYLVTHMNLHTMEKLFTCNDCGKIFRQKSNLMGHMKTHSNIKLHVCNECGKKFIRKSDLITHTYIHTGEKPLSCSYCYKSFRRSGALISHTKIHTRDKQFSCYCCDMKFIQKCDMIKHTKIHYKK